ncbi:hypothetical protein FRC20_009870 [Serendipita sp. 405]|nr:hypothetical protein FRC20_009870 [Serendipita sp. 405]
MVRSWGKKNRTPIYSEEVVIAEPGSDDPNPWIHWIGECPRGPTTRKVVLYIHGGGFVLPLSEGHLPMMTSLLREAKQEIKPPPLLVAAEYTLAPYGQYPTQLRQCISIIRYLHQRYGVDSSNLLIAGDSCGGALGLSILSQLLHPSPTLPLLPYTSGVSKPLAGLLLISPWTSFSTSAGSYNENAGKDTLPPDIIRRFRDTYISRSSLAPGSEADPLKVSSTTGPWYRSTPDPLVTGLKEGVGAIRPPGHSQQETQQEGWWANTPAAARRILITAGQHECFRDDVVETAEQLKKACQHDSPAEVKLIVDESFHAVIVSDYAFGAAPGDLAAKISGWLVEVLKA